jgi:alpha-ketoglutarate-dependent taurine dioxygenase
MPIERIPLTPHLGLEIRGVDLSREIDAATEREILDAWIDAGVGAAHDQAGRTDG